MDGSLELPPYSVSTGTLSAVPFHSPLHSASVYVSHLTNPVPVGRGGDGRGREERFGEDYLSPMKLRELTGETDLSQVTYLEVSVNSQTGSLGNFGANLPALVELRCSESVVPCVRDLGTSLTQLTVLWLPQCGLHDLDGLPSLSSLRELYVAFNEVCDVSVTAMLPSLQVLDMEGNQVSEVDQLGYLGLCGELSSLTLAGNPLAQHIADQQGGEVGYRVAVLKALPQLKVLDDISVTHRTPSLSPPSPSSSLSLSTGLSSQSMNFSRIEVVKSGVGEREQPLDRISPLPTRPRTAFSPGGAGRVSPRGDDSSDLTHGLSQVICGNPVRALKARRRCGLTSQLQSAVTSPPPGAPPHTSPTSLDYLMEELSVTKATSVVHLTRQADDLTPPLPPAPSTSRQHRLPPPSSSTQQQHHTQLPIPPPSYSSPSVLSARPHSVADFRHRRYCRAASPPVTRSASVDPHTSPSSLTLTSSNSHATP